MTLPFRLDLLCVLSITASTLDPWALGYRDMAAHHETVDRHVSLVGVLAARLG